MFLRIIPCADWITYCESRHSSTLRHIDLEKYIWRPATGCGNKSWYCEGSLPAGQVGGALNRGTGGDCAAGCAAGLSQVAQPVAWAQHVFFSPFVQPFIFRRMNFRASFSSGATSLDFESFS